MVDVQVAAVTTLQSKVSNSPVHIYASPYGKNGDPRAACGMTVSYFQLEHLQPLTKITCEKCKYTRTYKDKKKGAL